MRHVDALPTAVLIDLPAAQRPRPRDETRQTDLATPWLMFALLATLHQYREGKVAARGRPLICSSLRLFCVPMALPRAQHSPSMCKSVPSIAARDGDNRTLLRHLQQHWIAIPLSLTARGLILSGRHEPGSSGGVTHFGRYALPARWARAAECLAIAYHPRRTTTSRITPVTLNPPDSKPRGFDSLRSVGVASAFPWPMHEYCPVMAACPAESERTVLVSVTASAGDLRQHRLNFGTASSRLGHISWRAAPDARQISPRWAWRSVIGI